MLTLLKPAYTKINKGEKNIQTHCQDKACSSYNYPSLKSKREPFKLYHDSGISGSSALLPSGDAIPMHRQIFLSCSIFDLNKSSFHLLHNNKAMSQCKLYILNDLLRENNCDFIYPILFQ